MEKLAGVCHLQIIELNFFSIMYTYLSIGEAFRHLHNFFMINTKISFQNKEEC